MLRKLLIITVRLEEACSLNGGNGKRARDPGCYHHES